MPAPLAVATFFLDQRRRRFVTGLAGATVLFLSMVLLVLFTPVESTTTGGGGGQCGAVGEAPDSLESLFSGNTAKIAEAQRNATTIISVGQRNGVPARGWQVALATGLQESALQNLQGGDRDSAGVFQQRPSMGWGTMAQITNPALAAAAFYGRATHTHNTGLLQIPNWQTLPITAAAQAVQRSGYPDAYAQWEPLAAQLVASITGTDPSTDVTAAAVPCSTAPAPGAIPSDVTGPLTSPLAPPMTMTSAFGMRYHPIRHTHRLHAGTDFAASIGTPVRSIMAGTVALVEQDPGGWGTYVVVAHAGGIDSLYAHLSQAQVTVGARVAAGQQIALSGNTGGSTGPHLHLEIRPGSSGIRMGGPIDPVAWYRAQGKPLDL